jgi:hypothetical protein
VIQDPDVCYRRTPDNVRRPASPLGHLHPNLRGLPVKVLSLERLIAMKPAAGRAKDLAMLPLLVATPHATTRTLRESTRRPPSLPRR